MWKRFLSESLDIVYPPKCYYCNVALKGGRYICDACCLDLKRLSFPFCDRCSEPFEGAIDDIFLCPNCAGTKLSFDFARSVLESSTNTRKLVHGLKYSNQYQLFKKSAEMMVEVFQQDHRLRGKEWFLTPVPMHWKRRFKRGYNQSEELTRVLAKELQLPWGNIIKRTRATKTQTKLGRSQRHQNLHGCFQSNYSQEALEGKNILLIDDVLTTGFTAHYCAECIRNGFSVKQLAVLTLLRG